MLPKWIKHDKTKTVETEQNESGEKTGLFAIKGVIPGIASLGFYCSMEFIIGTWGASYIVNVYSLGADIAARWVSLYFGGIMLGRIISGFVSDRMGDDFMIRAGGILSAAGIIPSGNIKINANPSFRKGFAQRIYSHRAWFRAGFPERYPRCSVKIRRKVFCRYNGFSYGRSLRNGFLISACARLCGNGYFFQNYAVRADLFTWLNAPVQ